MNSRWMSSGYRPSFSEATNNAEKYRKIFILSAACCTCGFSLHKHYKALSGNLLYAQWSLCMNLLAIEKHFGLRQRFQSSVSGARLRNQWVWLIKEWTWSIYKKTCHFHTTRHHQNCWYKDCFLYTMHWQCIIWYHQSIIFVFLFAISSYCCINYLLKNHTRVLCMHIYVRENTKQGT